MITCAFTKLPISEMDKVVVIPLKEFNFKSETNHGVTPSVLYENTTDFVPFTLPIIGYYDESEGLVDIQKDSNTKVIENKYSMSIEDFLSIVFCHRNFNDSYSSLFKQFAKNKETFELFFKDQKKYFEHFGFIKEVDYIYKHTSLDDCLFFIEESQLKVTCMKNNEVVFKNQLSLEKTLENISKHFNIELNAEKDNIHLENLKGLSSMVIRYDVYEKFILNKSVLKDFFENGWIDFKETSKNAYLMIGASKLGVEFKCFENIIIYCDDFKDELKDKFYELLKIQSFMYKTGLYYYPNKQLIQDDYEILQELFEFQLNKLKEEM